MKLRFAEYVMGIFVLISFIAAIIIYPHMPEQVASHWNAQGEVDGYMGQFWGTFLLPTVLLGLCVTFFLIPRIDPLRQNIAKFRCYFDWFIILMAVFLKYIYTLTVIYNIWFHFHMTRFMLPSVGIVLIYAGIMMKHARRNWFIGIRTPWTLSSEHSWKKTHELGYKLFVIAGILSFAGILFPHHAVYILMVPLLAFVVILIVYSYLMYKK